MKLRIFTEPQQGGTYDELLAVARTSERLGFDAFFRSDHYMRIGPGDHGSGSTDAWLTLAGLARETSTIRLGTLVTPATFRLPGVLAISVAQVDQMSGGRVELGLGTGWFDAEHTAYGVPFPPVSERFSRFEEQLEILTGLWTTPVGKTFSFEGSHYRLADSPALPKPVQSPRPPIIIGGFGARRTPRLAARFADEYNLPFRTLEDTAVGFDRVREACEAQGRSSIVFSVAQTVCVGSDDAELARRAGAIGQDVADLRAGGLAGTPAEVVEKIGKFAELGAERVYLQVMDLGDLDHLELIAAEVLPHV
ncbi:LLM class F420-dependent oxidoreductase [Planobispora rosea]|uniref:LLM class F420-dependent oxidoreductase n=1 Tax=Planobispora rosea TaxID=35762 RepID=A0A8J3WCK7_PLARO|nr:LLM class F420-dependent oxidoreductase [Planobispora rosea]GGS51873.1 LLM class F420-dependent oxidoreductase [Planobispora rosea]GIH82981.1 LLM class F420-dependent oxidoreductase [Planobispora rosea]